MKKICTLLALLCSLQGIAQLTTGDIAIIALNPELNGANQQTLAFVALKNIPAGQRITFSDIAWNNNLGGGQFITTPAATDGHVTWIAPAGGVPGGEVIILHGAAQFGGGGPLITGVTPRNQQNVVRGNCIVGNSFYWGDNGTNPTSHPDQVIAYLGDPTNTPATANLLWGWSTSNFIFNAANDSSSSDLPAALNILYNVALGSPAGGGSDADNAHFVNTNNPAPVKTNLDIRGRISGLQKAFANKDLYRTDNNPLAYPSYQFNVVTAVDLPNQGQLVEIWDLNGNGTGDENSPNGNVTGRNVGSSFTSAFMQLTTFPSNTPAPDPAADPDNKSGIEIRTRTLGYSDLTLDFSFQIAVGAVNSFRIFYSSDNGANWLPHDLTQSSVAFSTIATTSPSVLEVYSDNNLLKFTVDEASTNTGFVRVQISGFPADLDNIITALFRILAEPDPEITAPFAYSTINLTDPYTTSAIINFNEVKVTANVVLPLTLTNFTAAAKNSAVQLDWQTAEEVNVKEFQVQKSINGADYTAIATVAAKNQTTNSYSYTDNQPNQGTNYYRLKMVDQDGSFTYSTIKAIQGTSNNGTTTVSPTLAQNQITVKYKQLTENATLVITNLQGQKLLTQPLSKGSNATVIPVSQLAKGSYFVIINDQPAIQFVKQ